MIISISELQPLIFSTPCLVLTSTTTEDLFAFRCKCRPEDSISCWLSGNGPKFRKELPCGDSSLIVSAPYPASNRAAYEPATSLVISKTRMP